MDKEHTWLIRDWAKAISAETLLVLVAVVVIMMVVALAMMVTVAVIVPR